MKYTEEHELWMTNDKLFFNQLEVGREGELKVAQYLLTNGIPVQLPPLRVRENVEDRSEFRNQADLYTGPWNRKPYRIEVKHLDYAFSSSFDFPWKNVIVVTTNKWDNVKQSGNTPLCFVMVSQQGSGMFVIPEWTEKYWEKRVVRDRKRNMDIEVWQVDTKHAREMDSLVTWLKGML